MAEYINREALIAEYDRVHKGPAGGARKLMVEAPAVDVAEVKHGRWVEEGCGLLVCSKCNFEYDHSGVPFEGLYYCPNCGAKMDGEKNRG